MLLGAVQTTAQFKIGFGEVPFSGKIEKLFLVVFGHEKQFVDSNWPSESDLAISLFSCESRLYRKSERVHYF